MVHCSLGNVVRTGSIDGAHRQNPRLDLMGTCDDGDEAPRAAGAHDAQLPRSRPRTGLSKRSRPESNASPSSSKEFAPPAQLLPWCSVPKNRGFLRLYVGSWAVSAGFFVGPRLRSARGPQQDNERAAPVDGSAWTEDDCSRHVLRGGSLSRAVQTRRAAARIWFGPPNRMHYRSVRVARTLQR